MFKFKNLLKTDLFRCAYFNGDITVNEDTFYVHIFYLCIIIIYLFVIFIY